MSSKTFVKTMWSKFQQNRSKNVEIKDPYRHTYTHKHTHIHTLTHTKTKKVSAGSGKVLLDYMNFIKMAKNWF